MQVGRVNAAPERREHGTAATDDDDLRVFEVQHLPDGLQHERCAHPICGVREDLALREKLAGRLRPGGLSRDQECACAGDEEGCSDERDQRDGESASHASR